MIFTACRHYIVSLYYIKVHNKTSTALAPLPSSHPVAIHVWFTVVRCRNLKQRTRRSAFLSCHCYQARSVFMNNTLLRLLWTNQRDFSPKNACPRHCVEQSNSYAGGQMVKIIALWGRWLKRYDGSAQVTIGVFWKAMDEEMHSLNTWTGKLVPGWFLWHGWDALFIVVANNCCVVYGVSYLNQKYRIVLD